MVVDILKATMSFDFERVKRLKQSDSPNRISKLSIIASIIEISHYTKIIKWTKYYTDIFFFLVLQKIGDILLYWFIPSIPLYSYLFNHSIKIVYFLLSKNFFFLYITIISLLAFSHRFFRSITSFLCSLKFIFVLIYLFQWNFRIICTYYRHTCDIHNRLPLLGIGFEWIFSFMYFLPFYFSPLFSRWLRNDEKWRKSPMDILKQSFPKNSLSFR